MILEGDKVRVVCVTCAEGSECKFNGMIGEAVMVLSKHQIGVRVKHQRNMLFFSEAQLELIDELFS